MEKARVLDLLQVIATYFKNYHYEDLRFEVEAWHLILKDYEYQPVHEKLIEYVKSGERFPPNVGQLINSTNGKQSRAIPSHEETRAMMIGWDEQRDEVATREDVDKHLAKMREILGIQRGNGE